ncbi:hypothetical protein ACP275_01G058300 [Erythranthe tilingii]
MAEAFLQIVLENLSSLIQGEIGLILGVDEEMNNLFSTLTTIQSVLEDAEMKQLKLNDLTYEIDDILDECATKFFMEDVGNNICDELVLRSLLQYDSRDADEKTLIMHDLVRDLAQSIMENKIPKSSKANDR